MGKKPFRNCFISVPMELNTQPLLSLLIQKGINGFDAYTLGHNNTVSSIEDKIINSDFMIAVLTPELSNNVFYEIGLARGANKPIFLIVQGNLSIPNFLMDTVYVKASVDDINLISFYLDQFISKKEKTKTTAKRMKFPTKASQKIESPLEDELKDIIERGTEDRLLQFVKNFFERQGALVDVAHGMEEKGADMSIWIDALDKILGNPILVELKFGNLTQRKLEIAELSMKNYLSRANIRTGLIIYLDRNGGVFRRSKVKVPFIMRFDIRDLIKKSRDLPIDRILYQERNKLAHQS